MLRDRDDAAVIAVEEIPIWGEPEMAQNTGRAGHGTQHSNGIRTWADKFAEPEYPLARPTMALPGRPPLSADPPLIGPKGPPITRTAVQ